jgi:hypothetical protein
VEVSDQMTIRVLQKEVQSWLLKQPTTAVLVVLEGDISHDNGATTYVTDQGQDAHKHDGIRTVSESARQRMTQT